MVCVTARALSAIAIRFPATKVVVLSPNFFLLHFSFSTTHSPMPEDTSSPLIPDPPSSPTSNRKDGRLRMSEETSAALGGVRRGKKVTLFLILSYVFDWVVLIVVGVVGAILGNITPNKRPFSLEDPNISYATLPPHHAPQGWAYS